MSISEKEIVELEITKRSHPLLNPLDYLVAIAQLSRASYDHEHNTSTCAIVLRDIIFLR